jgi:hypothetical protein
MRTTFDVGRAGARVALAAASLLVACAGSTTSGGRVLHDSRVVSCELLLDDLKVLDVDNATEERLSRAMDEAIRSREGCGLAWMSSATNAYERTIARHREHQLTLRSLVIESVLSERFDGAAHVCDIQREIFRILLADIRALEDALNGTGLSEAERRQLTQLRELDVESLDVLVVAHASFCRD